MSNTEHQQPDTTSFLSRHRTICAVLEELRGVCERVMLIDEFDEANQLINEAKDYAQRMSNRLMEYKRAEQTTIMNYETTKQTHK